MLTQVKSAARWTVYQSASALDWTYAWHRQIIINGVLILLATCIADVMIIQTGHMSISRDVWIFDCANPFAIVGGIVLAIGLMWLVQSWWAAGIIAALATHLFILPLEISTLPMIQHKRGDVGPNELTIWMTALNGVTTAIAAAVTCWTIWVGYLKIRGAQKAGGR